MDSLQIVGRLGVMGLMARTYFSNRDAPVDRLIITRIVELGNNSPGLHIGRGVFIGCEG
jgi:hypothetical protein